MKLKNSLYYILDGFVLILFLLMNIPQLRLLPFYNYLCLGVILIILFLTITKSRALRFRDKPTMVMLLIYTLFVTLIPLLFDQVQIFNRYLALSEGLIFYVIYEYNKCNRGNSVNIRYLVIFVVLQLYTLFSTINALLHNGQACRLLKSTFVPGDITYSLLLQGVSGYDLIYSSVIVTVVLLCLIMFGNKYLNNKYKLLIRTSILLFSVLIILSNYFTAAILLLCGFAFAIAAQRGAKIFLFLIPFLCIYGLAHETINKAAFDTVLSVIPEGKTHDRIAIIQRNLDNSDLEDLDSREYTTVKSEDLILDYPLLGYISSGVFNLTNVGQHSYILDTMAIYGVFIGLFGCYAISSPFIYIYRKTRNIKLKRFCLLIGCLYVFLLYRNNTTLAISYSVYFYFPTLYSYLQEQHRLSAQSARL